MKRSQLIITLLLLALLLGIAFCFRLPINYGAVPWFGWIVLAAFVLCLGAGLIVLDTTKRRRYILAPVAEAETAAETARDNTAKLLPVGPDPNRPPYPHPVINPQTCIGCHACVEACPHDVLAMVSGIAVAIALDQCVEDTGCQVECPTNPKSCIVVNTSKVLPERQVPRRDHQFMTNVPGLYLIGDVSGVPLIKNAINEGGAVIEHIAEELRQAPSLKDNGAADYDVAIIGIGPAGLSAAALAQQRGLKYIAIEQDQVLAAIQQAYQAGKLVYFKPEEVEVIGGIPLPEAPAPKELMIQLWLDALRFYRLQINEFERCKGVKPDGGVFVVTTEHDKTKQQAQYKARRVILAIGNRGTPMRLKVPGEELKVEVTPTEPVLPAFCNKCGTQRLHQANFCRECGTKYVGLIPPPFEDDKVKYRLNDPNQYQGKHCLVVGAGNSAVEATVDLAAYRSADGDKITGWRDNTVTLVIRSDFKSDLKLGNKMLVYEGIDEGRIKAYFHTTVKEITETEVVLMDARAPDSQKAQEKARVKNDYVFALIGGDKPTKFLESIGIQVG
jgi:thioredoxin reductase (NADPH)